MILLIRRRLAGALFCILLTAALMVSCRGGNEKSDRMRGITDNLSPMKVNIPQDQGVLYEITQLASPGDDAELCCAGLYDESSLLLLYLIPGSRDAVSSYSAQLLDLSNGEKQILASFDRTEAPGHSSDGTEDLLVLSCDPLIVFDSCSGILYRPGSSAGSVILPSYLSDAAPYWLSGRLLLSSGRGIVYEVTEEGDLTVLWTLPAEFGAFTPVISGRQGFLTFATYARRDPSLQVYVDVDPAAGSSEYYLSDINPSRFSVFKDGLLLGTSFRTKPLLSVCSPEEHVKKELELPDEIKGRLDGSGDEGFLALDTFPQSLSADWCLFTLNDSAGRPVHLYLWDTASCSPVSWKGPNRSPYTAPQSADYGVVSERARELEDKYGVRILIGSDIPTEFQDYEAEPFEETGAISGSLSVLENVFSLYPDTYFSDLKGGYYRNIVFYLTGPLRPFNADSSISNASAFATESCGTLQLAFDLYDDLSPGTVIHELTHAADYRFLGEGLLDEDAWNALNPEGFSYYMSYIDESGESYETAGSAEHTAMSDAPADDVWFIDPYSKTYPMEDRARLMENLLMGKTPYAYCYEGIHVQEKLSFYFRFLRDTLGSDSWPLRTSWEKALEEAALAK